MLKALLGFCSCVEFVVNFHSVGSVSVVSRSWCRLQGCSLVCLQNRKVDYPLALGRSL